jgi:hypothetical protein
MTELKIQTIQIMVAIENLALLKSHHFWIWKHWCLNPAV